MTTNMANMCLIFSVGDFDSNDCLDQRNNLSDYLESKGFRNLDNSGTRACFADGDFAKFSRLATRWCKKNNVVLNWARHMPDPGLGLILPEDLEELKALTVPKVEPVPVKEKVEEKEPEKKVVPKIGWFVRMHRAKYDEFWMIPETVFGTHGLPSIEEFWASVERPGSYQKILKKLCETNKEIECEMVYYSGSLFSTKNLKHIVFSLSDSADY